MAASSRPPPPCNICPCQSISRLGFTMEAHCIKKWVTLRPDGVFHSSNSVSGNFQNSIENGFSHSASNRKMFLVNRKELIKDNNRKQIHISEDHATYGSLLRGCGDAKEFAEGKRLHSAILKAGFGQDRFLWNLLMEMYGKCAKIEYVHVIFDSIRIRNIFSWTICIAAFCQNGYHKDALRLFRQMQLEGIVPNKVTLSTILGACSEPSALWDGKIIHGCIKGTGLEMDIVVGTALVTMYGKCASTEDAERIFYKMTQRNEITWTAMLTSYSHNGHGKQAIKLFQQMQQEGMKLNLVACLIVLDACGNLAALEEGKQLHEDLLLSHVPLDDIIWTALVSMYGKCGKLDDARRVFDTMYEKNTVSSTAMIAAYAQHGHAHEAFDIFRQMLHLGIKPDKVTFLNILDGFSHAGLLDQGCLQLISIRDHGIAPTMELYGCMIDLLGRLGLLDESEDLMCSMQFQPNAVVWTTMLGASKIHDDSRLAISAAEHVIELEPSNAGPYVLLSNVYATARRWEDVARVRKLMAERGVRIRRGCSSIEVRNDVHEFSAEDRSHPQTKEIYAQLEKLNIEMIENGYLPDNRAALWDVEEEASFCYHSEKLAIAFGLLNTPPGTPLRIIKNLRVCIDCHTAAKFISQMVHREILVRDTSRFHLFKAGECSCGDYW